MEMQDTAWWVLPQEHLLPIDTHAPVLAWSKIAVAKRAILAKEVLHEFEASGYLEKDDIEPFLKAVEELGGRLAQHDMDEDAFEGGHAIWIWPHSCLNLNITRGNASLNAFTSDADLTEKLEKIAELLKPITMARKATVHMLGKGRHGLELFNIGVAGCKIEEDNYQKEVFEGYSKLVEDLNSETPAGRLGILTGPPGTGKT